MNPHRFDDLRERLLRAGVAPRHVHRYICELRDHHEDIVRSELHQGRDRRHAEASAWERLGTEEDLARSVLARPELRALGARFPALVFGAGPTVFWATIVVSVLSAARLAAGLLGGGSHQEPSWLLSSAYALCILCVRVLPVGLAMAMVVMSIRQRANLFWPAVGTALVNIIAVAFSIQVFAPTMGQGGQLGVSSALLPFVAPFSDLFGPRDVLALADGLVRAAFMLAMAWFPYSVWRWRLADSGSTRWRA